MDMMVTKVIELRKGKLDEAQAREACLHRNFFGTMYEKLGCADGMLGGATSVLYTHTPLPSNRAV